MLQTVKDIVALLVGDDLITSDKVSWKLSCFLNAMFAQLQRHPPDDDAYGRWALQTTTGAFSATQRTRRAPLGPRGCARDTPRYAAPSSQRRKVKEGLEAQLKEATEKRAEAESKLAALRAAAPADSARPGLAPANVRTARSVRSVRSVRSPQRTRLCGQTPSPPPPPWPAVAAHGGAAGVRCSDCGGRAAVERARLVRCQRPRAAAAAARAGAGGAGRGEPLVRTDCGGQWPRTAGELGCAAEG